MNDIRKRLLAAVSRTAAKIARREAEEWPPLCLGRYYQPVRPVRTDVSGPKTDKAHPVENDS